MTQMITLSVPGMSCGHCESSIVSEVGTLPGVASVDVDLDAKSVTVHGDDLDRQTIVAAIDDAGFDVY